MPDAPARAADAFLEANDSQAAALAVFRALGYTELSPAEALAARHGRHGAVVLDTVLTASLARLNGYTWRGRDHAFTDAALRTAADAVQAPRDANVVHANEAVYDLLTLGLPVEQQPDGERKSFTVRYVDWERPEANALHVTREFAVRGPDGVVRRADVVAFVNGLPWVVVECKRRDDPAAIDKAARDAADRTDEMPQLMVQAQFVLAATGQALEAGTAGTPAEHFAPWRPAEERVDGLTAEVRAALGRTPSVQDLALWDLARPARLFDLVRHYVLFEGGRKVVPRHQQVAAVEQTLARVRQQREEGTGTGSGIVWHTQGSGKSLTMVYLFRALTRLVPGARAVLVTDRVNLDGQISATFKRASVTVHRARSGPDLIHALRDESTRVVTTVIDKFFQAVEKSGVISDDPDLFVLVDEAHRSQFGRKHTEMVRALPGACFLGFTGTPVVRKNRNVLARFGPFLHRYTLHDALRDEVIVPILYESRLPELAVSSVLDRHTDRVLETADPYQVEAAKAQLARKSELYQSEQVVEEVAAHVARHFREHVRGTGLKAILAVPLKATALRYLEWFQNEPVALEDRLDAAVVISEPDEPEARGDDPDDARVRTFWAGIVASDRTAEAYEERVVSSFTHDPTGTELLIVVGKLLTGFDAPRTGVLYVAKPLSSHTLLQAIARVNRVFPGKDYGLVMDYYGILGNLDQALTEYAALADFDEAELARTITDVRVEVDALPHTHSALLDFFAAKGLRPGPHADLTAWEDALEHENERHEFYALLTAFVNTLDLALASLYFHETPRLKTREPVYRDDLRFFHTLRRAVQSRYSEKTDHREYLTRLRRLLDRFVHVEDVVPLTERGVNIFDPDAFLREVERLGGSPASVADTIAHQVRRTLTLRMDEDPARYRRFSELLEEAIARFRAERLGAEAYLARVREIYDDLVHGGRGFPPSIADRPDAQPYFSSLQAALATETDAAETDAAAGDGSAGAPPDPVALADAALGIERIVHAHRIVDWRRNPDAEAAIRNAVEDHLFAWGEHTGTPLSFDAIDLVLDDVVRIARERGA